MILYPKAYFAKVEDIDINFLKKSNIKVLLLDVDNTLVDRSKKLSESTINWVKELKGQGMKLCILSNTYDKAKVESVAEQLGLKYFIKAKKPLKSGFLKAQKYLNEKSDRIAIVGDQIFTDVIGGNRCKMYTILVDPINEKEFWYTLWKRPIENRIKKKINKNVKGEDHVL